MKIGSLELEPRALFVSLGIGAGAAVLSYSFVVESIKAQEERNSQVEQCIGQSARTEAYVECVGGLEGSRTVEIPIESITLHETTPTFSVLTLPSSRAALLEQFIEEPLYDHTSKWVLSTLALALTTSASYASYTGVRKYQEAKN